MSARERTLEAINLYITRGYVGLPPDDPLEVVAAIDAELDALREAGARRVEDLEGLVWEDGIDSQFDAGYRAALTDAAAAIRRKP